MKEIPRREIDNCWDCPHFEECGVLQDVHFCQNSSKEISNEQANSYTIPEFCELKDVE